MKFHNYIADLYEKYGRGEITSAKLKSALLPININSIFSKEEIAESIAQKMIEIGRAEECGCDGLTSCREPPTI